MYWQVMARSIGAETLAAASSGATRPSSPRYFQQHGATQRVADLDRGSASLCG